MFKLSLLIDSEGGNHPPLPFYILPGAKAEALAPEKKALCF
jgi:hypothetical protein